VSSLKTAVLGAIGSRFMAQARVDAVDIISDRFRLITLSSDKLKSATMQPTAKVRLNAGDWEMRAYTPLSFDAVAGRVQVLAYLHGDGPGSVWGRSTAPGDLTHIMGLQESLNLLGLSQPAVFFGDETSLAAAKTLQSHLAPGSATRLLFEVSSQSEAQTVADRLCLRNAQYYVRQTDDAHIPIVTKAIQHALADIATSHLVLTGNGRSIQSIRASLRTGNSGVIDYHVKAYWAPGKTGLE
jgi:ferric-chelate reductase (NADPH)